MIVFTDPAGHRHEVDAANGSSAMDAAIKAAVPGIYAMCGGTCSCATCHVYVDADWLARVGAPDDLEDGMLDSAIGRRANSRLSCQIVISDTLDGLLLEVADNDL